MKRILVIGCPGSGKSTFARKLAAKTGHSLHHLDIVWHKPDRTNVSTEEFDEKLGAILSLDEWIIDGNYLRTLPLRLSSCDTVFFFDLPVETCLEGAKSRIGMKRDDMPWVEEKMDPEFRQWIIDFPKVQLPQINKILESCGKNVIVFNSHEEADKFLAVFSDSDIRNLNIVEISSDKHRYMNLLLLGDEQESMIDRYIDESRLFIGYMGELPTACCAVKMEHDKTVEVKNLAVLPEHRRRGIGRRMLEYMESLYAGKTFQLGTGETPSTLHFYHNCGYRISHRIPNFFTDNYDHPIVEEGVLLKDMIYLSKKV